MYSESSPTEYVLGSNQFFQPSIQTHVHFGADGFRTHRESSTADHVLLLREWEGKDGKKPLHLTCALLSGVRGQRPSLFFLDPLPNSAPPTDRRDREEEGRRVAQSNSLFPSSAAPALLPPTWLRRILSFSLLRPPRRRVLPPTA